MNKQPTTQSVPSLELRLRQALGAMETAQDETSAAQAYASLKSAVELYIRRSSESREELYKLKNTVTRQAHTLAEIELAEMIGEKAPGPACMTQSGREASSLPSLQDFPDIISVQQSPDFFFIRLSYGLVNIRHIVELDVKARTLFTTTGTRSLLAADIKTLLFHLQMYRPS